MDISRRVSLMLFTVVSPIIGFTFFANFVYFNVLNTTLSGGSLHPKGLKMVGFYLVPLQL